MIFAAIILLAIVTRFYNLGARVMSHDESLHTYFSWLLYRGQGYEHSPMMHGPFQFHIVALIYFLFGASDFTSRIPAALFSIATVWMVWYWRRYLGKWGALIAGFLLVISPYMLYYGRYVRNESFVGFSGLVMLYAMLRHLEVGGKKYLFLLAGALALHFTTKETAFIYAAQALIYLAIYFIAQVTRRPWEAQKRITAPSSLRSSSQFCSRAQPWDTASTRATAGIISATETAPAKRPFRDNFASCPCEAYRYPNIDPRVSRSSSQSLSPPYSLFEDIPGSVFRNERSFDMLMVTGTIVLPNLSAFAH